MIPSQTVYIPFDTPPRLIEQAVPVYPDMAARAEVEGMVVAAVTIDETGGVIKAWIVHSDAVILNDAAVSVWWGFQLDIGRGNW